MKPAGRAAAEVEQLRRDLADSRHELVAEASAHGRTVDELAFWKHQAIWHRAMMSALAQGKPPTYRPDTVDERLAEKELEAARHQENRERYGEFAREAG